MHEVVGQVALELHVVGVLHIVGLLVGLAVEIDDAVLDLQRLSRQSHASFHIVLAAIGGSRVDGTVGVGVVGNVVAAQVVDHLKVVVLLLSV